MATGHILGTNLRERSRSCWLGVLYVHKEADADVLGY